MNTLDPELKSLEKDLNEITDFSDMKAAKVGGEKILEHLNSQTKGANSPSATHSHTVEDSVHHHHHEGTPSDAVKAAAEKKAEESSDKKSSTKVTVKKPEQTVAQDAADAIKKIAELRTKIPAKSD